MRDESINKRRQIDMNLALYFLWQEVALPVREDKPVSVLSTDIANHGWSGHRVHYTAKQRLSEFAGGT